MFLLTTSRSISAQYFCKKDPGVYECMFKNEELGTGGPFWKFNPLKPDLKKKIMIFEMRIAKIKAPMKS